MNSKWLLAMLAVMLLLATGTGQILSVKATTTRSFSLYGSYSTGWGFTPESITSPGPKIMVEQGDTVNMTLISNDGFTHQFFVSYTNSSSPSLSDPESQSFSGTLNFQFVATTTIGTYEYRCTVHPVVMWGYFQVVASGTIPEFPSPVALMLFFAATTIAIIAYERKRKI